MMPFDIDLNAPCYVFDAIDNAVTDCSKSPPVAINFNSKENRAPNIQVDDRSSSMSGLFPIDLNASPPYEVEDVYSNECGASLSNNDVDKDNNTYDLRLDEEIQDDPYTGRDEEGDDNLTKA
ncbi:Bacterial extracellular solute-binding protein, family 7 [Sesbania bispinosa]|nr:Bacterial extracellular solute-binding protein, family 7 [Sesbania bispinosa]